MKKKLSDKEMHTLQLRLSKENKDFADLCDARNEVVRTIAHHQVVERALLAELDKWDIKIEKILQKEKDKEIKLKTRK